MKSSIAMRKARVMEMEKKSKVRQQKVEKRERKATTVARIANGISKAVSTKNKPTVLRKKK